jgi:septal ring factor EnvC (AmiA/AmiB activator)
VRFGIITPYIVAFLAAALAAGQPRLSAASEEQSYAAQLERLRARIQSLKTDIERDKTQRDATQEALDATERQIADINAQLLNTRKQLQQRSQRIQGLTADHRRHQQRLSQQGDQFGRLVYATYVMGRQGYIKMLLNQEDPARLGRAITYYRYFARARAQQIEQINQTLTTLQDLKARLDTENRELRELEKSQIHSRKTLQERRRERELLIGRLNQRIVNQGQELESLRRNERRLQRLLDELTVMVRDIPAEPRADMQFSQMRGKLHLPVRGRIAARFNQPKKGNMRWNGLFLNAREDEAVRAVFHGRIAFADWLRGFGLLLIIDHGGSYMSLYSHNKVLFKQVGDWVETGEPVAAVGTSGGLTKAGLYFEIRHNGKPRNPLIWCAAK